MWLLFHVNGTTRRVLPLGGPSNRIQGEHLRELTATLIKNPRSRSRRISEEAASYSPQPCAAYCSGTSGGFATSQEATLAIVILRNVCQKLLNNKDEGGNASVLYRIVSTRGRHYRGCGAGA